MNRRFILPLSLIVALLSLPVFTQVQAKTTKSDKPEIIVDTVAAVTSDSIEPITVVAGMADPYFRTPQSDTLTRVALVLSDIYGNKDLEFSRGFLMGLADAKLPKSSVALTIINGEIPEDSLKMTLSAFNPNVIFTTHERDTVKTVLNYSKDNFVKLFNVFDAKGEDYEGNPGVFQLLVPSNRFNANSSSYFLNNFSDNTLLIVGEPVMTDIILRDILVDWPEDKIEVVSKEDLDKTSFEEGTNYIVYPIASAEPDLLGIMDKIRDKISVSPLSGIRVIGRPNWITFKDLNKLVEGTETFIPVKCYFEPSSDVGKEFITAYSKQFGHSPIKSYPVYAVMGYDVASYFMPLLTGELLGTTGLWNPEEMLQSVFSIKDDGWGNGAYNNGSYILHFYPASQMEKEIIF